MLFFDKDEARDFYYGITCNQISANEAPELPEKKSGEIKFSLSKNNAFEAVTVISVPITLSREATLLHALEWDTSKNETYRKKIGDKTKKARSSLGLTQKDAANLIGVAFSSLQKAEAGDVEPNRENILKYLDFLNLEALFKKNINQAFLRRTMLTMPSALFGEKSAIDYATAKFPDGLKPVLATYRKTFE